MLAPASLDALRRIADRANDVLAAYTPGAFPLHDDVRTGGASLPSADPLSVAAPSDAWFVTLDRDGARVYSRAGQFHVADDGTLRTSDDARVVGVGGDGSSSVPIALPALDRALGRCRDLRLEADGTLVYTRAAIDPRTRERTSERVVAGRLVLARFPAGTAPQRLDATHVVAPPGVVPYVGAPADGTFAALRTHARDVGNVDVDRGLQRLSDAYVAFSALQSAYMASGESDQQVMDLVK